MKIQRTKNTGRNILFGGILKVYQIIIPFIMRTIMIYYMGITYAGLNNLFGSILQVLNLAELGIGAAMISSMYEPIAKDDRHKICALMNLYKKCFRIIGLIILLLGLLILPLIPRLISGTVPGGLNVRILYLIHLSVTVASYWLFAYKNSLLLAHQRNDINSKVALFTYTFQYALQIISILILRNYYYFVCTVLITQLMTNILTSRIVDKMYPEYHAVGKLKTEDYIEIRKKVQGLITNKLGGTIINSADSIVISAFLGISVLAVYQNYYFVITAVISLISIVYQACLAGIGNSLIVEEPKKNYADFKLMTFIVIWISGLCSACMLSLFQPFMELWMGTQNLLEFSIVICIVIYFYIYEIDQMIGTYKDAAGIWYADRFRPLITSLVNLGLNLTFVHFMGLYGIILSTVLSLLLVGTPWLIGNLFNSVFKSENPLNYVYLLMKYTLVTLGLIIITYAACNLIVDRGILSFAIKIFVCLFIYNVLFIAIYFKTNEIKKTFTILDKMLGGKMNLLLKKIYKIYR